MPFDSSSSSASSEFPAGSTPENRIEQVSAICSLGWRPHLVTGMLRQHLIAHFAEKSEIEDPGLRDYLWTSSAASQLLIETVHKWEPAKSGLRPALLLKRNAWRVERKGINDEHLGYVELSGATHYSTLMVGSHTLFCISSLPAEAEKLAAEVYRWLIYFFPVLRRELLLHRLVVAEVGELSEVEETNEHYTVPITIAYAHEEKWTIVPHAPRLKRLDLNFYEP